MQKPRLTDRTAEALGTALNILETEFYAVCDEKGAYYNEKELKRAIEYLEDLLRWKRQGETARFKPVASQSADTLSKRQG